VRGILFAFPMTKNISKTRKKPPVSDAKNYKHPESSSLLRPDVGVQPQFKKTKPPATYRYDSSLSPAMDWDQNSAREVGQWLIDIIAEWGRASHLFRWPQDLKGMNGEVLYRVNNIREAVNLLKF
jgi:adenine-specific DNA-methyltransferase